MNPTRELFSRHRLRCTKQRMMLYEVLAASTSHPTADELFRRVQPQCDGLSRATVYNTLEALCNAGLARRMPGVNGCCRFDADTSEHPHLRIRETSEIIDIPADLGQLLMDQVPQSVIAQIEQRLDVRVQGFNIQLHGSRIAP